jgi:hypothetical protein
MPRTCTVCAHPDRADIDAALVRGESSYALADRYSSLSRPAIQRHSENHLPATLVKASEAEEIAHADNLMTRLDELTQEAQRIGSKAENAGDFRTALSGVRELVRIVELQAKMIGELDERPTVNLHLQPEWIELRAVIVESLEPHPVARESVLRAIEGASDGSA